jgi:hypothetical protein
MKHLKRFNESNLLDQTVIDECKDILLELEDIGIKTNVSSYFNTGITTYTGSNWINFYFNRKEEFDYSDIEDVVERLKSYLSEFGLKIDWMSPIQNTSVINPMTFTPEGVRTQCELYFK